MTSTGQNLAQLKAPTLEPENFDDSTPPMEDLTSQQREDAAEETGSLVAQEDQKPDDTTPSSNSMDPSEVIESQENEEKEKLAEGDDQAIADALRAAKDNTSNVVIVGEDGNV